MNEIDQLLEEFKLTGGYGTVMTVRKDEMPEIVSAARAGDHDAQIRLGLVGKVLPQVNAGAQNCLYCGNRMTVDTLAAIVLIGPSLAPGQRALFCVVCDDCDETDPVKFKAKFANYMNIIPVQHEAGHA